MCKPARFFCGGDQFLDTPNPRACMQEMGLAFDEWDLDYYYKLFVEDMKRNPTNVELFDIAQVFSCLSAEPGSLDLQTERAHMLQ